MRNNPSARTKARALRRVLALTLMLCLLVTALPTAMAARYSSELRQATGDRTYIKVDGNVMFFTGESYGNGRTVTPSSGTVWQLYSSDSYTSPEDGLEYYSVYYQSSRYNVLKSDADSCLMSADEVASFITGVMWTQPSYDTLRRNMNLVGDIRVHAVQYALRRLGLYDGALDGSYGDGTEKAVRSFQKANGLGADGSAGPLTQPVLFALASGGAVSGGSGSSGGSTGGSSGSTVSGGSTAPLTGNLTTTASVNLRKNASISSPRLAVVPKRMSLAYTDTTVKNGVTWFKVRYNSLTGWLMGTYVNAGGNKTSPAIGSVTITKGGTRVRDAADGNKTGTLLAKGSMVDLLAQPTSKGGYTWYNIRTSTGLVGWVRGDCASASIGGVSGGTGSSGSTGGGSGSIIPSGSKTFVRLPSATMLFTSETKPSSGGTTVSAGTVLQLVSTDTYTSGGNTYCSLYYNNQKYNVLYNDIKSGIMSASELSAYVNQLWSSPLSSSLKRALDLVGDVRVYAMQVALSQLGYYTGNLDGTFGSGSESAVRNFQRKAKLEVDGACGSLTWAELTRQVRALNGGGVSGGVGGGSDSGTSGGVTVTNFGTVNRVVKVNWNYDDNGGTIYPKGTYATVMDVQTGKVFKVYRWSGGSHADCVPATAADTKTICDIVGFPYNSNHPNSSQLAKIKADGDSSRITYTWPDFKNAFGGAKDIGSAWDRRPALLNVNGTVYPVSIYGFPHGFNGTDSFSRSRFQNTNQLFYAVNNYYGMMCVHFLGSKTHTGTTPDSNHQANINTAYNYAKQLWPTLVK